MITYDNLWNILKEKNVSQYKLCNLGISHSTLDRLKKNQPVSTETINKLCFFLKCDICDIMTYSEYSLEDDFPVLPDDDYYIKSAANDSL